MKCSSLSQGNLNWNQLLYFRWYLELGFLLSKQERQASVCGSGQGITGVEITGNFSQTMGDILSSKKPMA